MAHVVEYLPSKCKTLSPNHRTTKKEIKKERRAIDSFSLGQRHGTKESQRDSKVSRTRLASFEDEGRCHEQEDGSLQCW
jgi:hypothetical protein